MYLGEQDVSQSLCLVHFSISLKLFDCQNVSFLLLFMGEDDQRRLSRRESDSDGQNRGLTLSSVSITLNSLHIIQPRPGTGRTHRAPVNSPQRQSSNSSSSSFSSSTNSRLRRTRTQPSSWLILLCNCKILHICAIVSFCKHEFKIHNNLYYKFCCHINSFHFRERLQLIIIFIVYHLLIMNWLIWSHLCFYLSFCRLNKFQGYCQWVYARIVPVSVFGDIVAICSLLKRFDCFFPNSSKVFTKHSNIYRCSADSFIFVFPFSTCICEDMSLTNCNMKKVYCLVSDSSTYILWVTGLENARNYNRGFKIKKKYWHMGHCFHTSNKTKSVASLSFLENVIYYIILWYTLVSGYEMSDVDLRPP